MEDRCGGRRQVGQEGGSWGGPSGLLMGPEGSNKKHFAIIVGTYNASVIQPLRWGFLQINLNEKLVP